MIPALRIMRYKARREMWEIGYGNRQDASAKERLVISGRIEAFQWIQEIEEEIKTDDPEIVLKEIRKRKPQYRMWCKSWKEQNEHSWYLIYKQAIRELPKIEAVLKEDKETKAGIFSVLQGLARAVEEDKEKEKPAEVATTE